MPEINQLYRRVRKHPMYIKENGTVSSALFKDSKGVSVSVDDNRNLDDIIKKEEELHVYYNKEKLDEDPEGMFKLIALASIQKLACDEKEVVIEMVPDGDINPYHAILKRNKDEICLTAGQSKYLARKTEIVKSYDENLIQKTK